MMVRGPKDELCYKESGSKKKSTAHQEEAFLEKLKVIGPQTITFLDFGCVNDTRCDMKHKAHRGAPVLLGRERDYPAGGERLLQGHPTTSAGCAGNFGGSCLPSRLEDHPCQVQAISALTPLT